MVERTQLQAEIERIEEAAGRMARRLNMTFVIDREKVETLETAHDAVCETAVANNRARRRA